MSGSSNEAHAMPIALIGIPLDHNSSHLRGCAGGPASIRAALSSGSSTWTAENGMDIASSVIDVGDVDVVEDDSARATIEAAIDLQLLQRRRTIAIGGDHSITYPILAAYARHFGQLSVVHFDAHPDLYDDFDGNRWSHASPFARVMEEGLVADLLQIGIRTLNAHQAEQAERFGVRIVPMETFDHATLAIPRAATYVTIDLDALDPAFAPGVSHHEPGGLSVRDILRIIARLPGPIVGADVVELNPVRDVNEMTATVAAKFVKELASRMLA